MNRSRAFDFSKLALSSDRQKWMMIAAATATAGTLCFAWMSMYVRRHRKKTIPVLPDLPPHAYDVVIVGAGPSGSTAAWFMHKGGAKVALLDKATFPRDKYCGDAVCTPAIKILEEMGVMSILKKHNEVHFADAGGLVSPSGYSYIGASSDKIGEAAACAVKRLHLDHRLMLQAKNAGVDIKQAFEVANAIFDQQSGLWSVMSEDNQEVTARVLVCADGATSSLATRLGFCTEPPRGVCSRAYVKGGTHNTKFDGVCFYHRESLPGYSAIFRHPDDELNFCYYLIPNGKDGWCGDVQESDLTKLHNSAIKNDPFVSKALGPKPDIERMRAASLRLGSQGLRQTYDDHLMIIGDAAGHIDPLTGEGIHTAMMGGKFAAQTLLEMKASGDYSKNMTKRYHDRWMRAFGHDFGISRKAANLIYRYPILLDACVKEMQRRGP